MVSTFTYKCVNAYTNLTKASLLAEDYRYVFSR